MLTSFSSVVVDQIGSDSELEPFSAALTELFSPTTQIDIEKTDRGKIVESTKHRKPRRLHGYTESSCNEDDEVDELDPFLPEDDNDFTPYDFDPGECWDENEDGVKSSSPTPIHLSFRTIAWVVASLLPMHRVESIAGSSNVSETATVTTPTLSTTEWILSLFTRYKELKTAKVDSE